MVQLHETCQALAKLESFLEKDEGVVEYLESVEMEVEEKAGKLFNFMKNYDDNMDAVDKEIERLKRLKLMNKTNYNKLKDYIAYSMGANGIEKIETDLVRFSFRKSKSVEIEKLENLEDKFIKQKVTLSADKTKIKKAIDAGEIVAGASLIEKKNLQIR